MLLEMQWWDWTDTQMQPAMPLLTSGDVEALHRHWQDVIRG
jgi:chloramphenicol O-acetyltransferase type B